MRRSLALALYLLAARRRDSGPAPDRPPRPEGRLLWFHLGENAGPGRLAQLAERLRRDRSDIRLLLTGDDVPATKGFPKGTLADSTPPERLPALRGFLDHWRPDVAVLAGSSLPPALITATGRRGIPLLLVDTRLTQQSLRPWRWRRGMAASLLSRFRRILVQDPETADRLTRLGGRHAPVEIAGRIEETTEPLGANEAERAALAELLDTRPVWFVVACPEAEEDAVIAAHTQAMRLAHRMLLIIAPADPGRIGALADRMRREGWEVAERARDQEPEPNVQAFVTDGETELGLWYRLAPVTFMGGTLNAGGPCRNPFEPAALGSAILHGPHPGPYPDAYARLTEAQAARLVETPAALAEAVGELIAPDKAAMLAHNAWAASSGGAEVAERVVQVILDTLEAGPAGAVT